MSVALKGAFKKAPAGLDLGLMTLRSSLAAVNGIYDSGRQATDEIAEKVASAAVSKSNAGSKTSRQTAGRRIKAA